MTTATSINTPVADVISVGLPEGVPYRLAADEYFRMAELDVIPEARRVGLWDGHLYEKAPKTLRHAATQSMLCGAVFRVLPEGWCPWLESLIRADAFSAPFPDLCVIRGKPDDSMRHGTFPDLSEVGLIVEVHETSLRKSLIASLQTYARAGLPCYWVINLVARRVEVYTDPETVGEVARYATSEVFEAGKDVPLVLDGRQIAVIPATDLLPEEMP